MDNKILIISTNQRPNMRLLVAAFILSLFQADNVNGQGRMLSPPGRSSLWRLGYNVPVDDNDNVLNCGGNKRRWETNQGKCGVCGDPWDETPRQNEAGGVYALGVIVGHYKPGSVIETIIDVASNGGGYFEFRLCENNNFSKAATQECFDKGLLFINDGNSTRYKQIQTGVNKVFIKLPDHVTCNQCILQWKYRTADQYGCGTDSMTNQTTCGFGYGQMQTEYYACADIAILDNTIDTGNVSYSSMGEGILQNNIHISLKRSRRQVQMHGMGGSRPPYIPNANLNRMRRPSMPQNRDSRPGRPRGQFNVGPNGGWTWKSGPINLNQNNIPSVIVQQPQPPQDTTPVAERIQIANPHLNGVISTTFHRGGQVRTSFNRRRKGIIPEHRGPPPTLVIPTEPTFIKTHSSAATFGGDMTRLATFQQNPPPAGSQQITIKKVSRSRPTFVKPSRIHRKFLDPMSANLGHSEVTLHQHTVTQKILRGASHATPTRQCEHCPFDQCLDDKLRLDYLFPGLFDSPTNFFDCKRYERVFTIGNYDVLKEGLPSCSHPRFKRQLQPFDDDDIGCCSTRPQVILPLTVEADNDTFSVVQLGDSKKQFIVQGICGKANTSVCTACAVENNFQWVLVYDPRVNTNPPVSFVPVKFPHYCRCYNYMQLKGRK
ncbi:hypothetical protein ACF0H5_013576 [Mactra antiquata]